MDYKQYHLLKVCEAKRFKEITESVLPFIPAGVVFIIISNSSKWLSAWLKFILLIFNDQLLKRDIVLFATVKVGRTILYNSFAIPLLAPPAPKINI